MKSRLIIVLMILIFVIILPFGFLYVLNNGNPYNKYIANKYIPAYLKDKHYNNQMILTKSYIEPKYVINRDLYHGHYVVVFKDEPDTSYYFGVLKKGKKVVQFCEKDKILSTGVTVTTTKKLGHSEEKCISSMSNRTID